MRARHRLTHAAVRTARPRERPYKLADGGGLYLLVNPDGSRYWRWKFRHAGREKLLSLGTFPDTPLASAREHHEALRRDLAAGGDPSAERRERKVRSGTASANTFEAVARAWHAERVPSWAPATAAKVFSFLEKDLFPWLGTRPVQDIGPADVLDCAERVAARGAGHTAQRVIRTAGAVMRYGVRKRLTPADPTRDLAGALPAPPVRHRAAITDPAVLAGLLRAIDGHRGSFIVRTALQLAPLLFVRPGELRRATWEEIDLDAATWGIPAGRMKMRAAHIVPLATQAVALLRDLHPLTYRRPQSFVFPGQRTMRRPMSENTVNAALRVLGFDKDTMTGHGFRATARTILHEHLDFAPDWIEAQLAHKVPDRHGNAYNRAAHLAGRRRMMQAWADYLDQLRAGVGHTDTGEPTSTEAKPGPGPADAAAFLQERHPLGVG